MRISLCLITKNCAKDLDIALNSVKGCYDELVITDTGSVDKTLEVAKKYGAKISEFKWTGKFDDARNYNFSQATGDWLMWMDSDDTIRGAEKIRSFIETLDSMVGAVSCQYEYAKDSHGNVSALQWRERIVRRDWFSWTSEGGLHEVMAPTRVSVNVALTDVVWEHHKFDLLIDDEATKKRNIAVLVSQIENKSFSSQKPLYFYNLANSFFAAGEYHYAAKLFQHFLSLDIWEEHEYISWIRYADSLRNLKKYDSALQAGLQAIKCKPEYPDAYFGLGRTYYELGDKKRAEQFLKICLSQPFPKTIIVCNPRDYDYNPMALLAQIYLETSQPEKALDYLLKCQKFVKKDSGETDRLIQEVTSVVAINEKADRFTKAVDLLNGNKNKIGQLLSALPREMITHPAVSIVRNRYFAKEKSSGRDLVIYCGQSVEAWTPDSIKTGIGGSEEAVINMAELLAQRGWRVTIYNTCGDQPKKFGHVWYRPFWEWNKADKNDVLIVWRQPYIFSYEINTPQKYLWLHDVPSANEFDDIRLNNITRIFVLSRFHRSLLPAIPDDKFFITANGIDPTQFEQGVERNSQKIIYGSSPDRGLECLVDLWPNIKDKVPEAELYVYYGWKTFDELNKTDKDKMAWKEIMVHKLEQPGIITKNIRIGHEELAREYLSSGIWAYPTEFPEISCITAMKAQSAGCIPVTTSTAALAETVRSGSSVDGDIYANKKTQKEFVNLIVKYLKKPIPIDSERFKKEFSWSAVADDWNKLLCQEAHQTETRP